MDEINQGMDPVNEEKIFNHIVQASSTMHNVNASIRRKGRRATDREQKGDDDTESKDAAAEADQKAAQDDDDNDCLDAPSTSSPSPSPQYILVSPKLHAEVVAGVGGGRERARPTMARQIWTWRMWMCWSSLSTTEWNEAT